MDDENNRILIELVNVQATPQAAELLEASETDVGTYLLRHSHGDWGLATDEQKFDYDLAALQKVGVARSKFRLPNGDFLLIQTRFNAVLTSIARPEELE